jgi:predicted NUDIX family NTP pyrophosphohydrolase
MVARSAGLLLFRSTTAGVVEVLLAHPGGPFWSRREGAAWSIPKGEYDPDADALATAYREFREETGHDAPAGEPIPLGEVRQPSGKRVTAWALLGDLDVTQASSNTFEMEWPRGSGTLREFPEVDRLEWMPVERARTKLPKGQVPFLDRLTESVNSGKRNPSSR